jgi:hypothetical protein
MPKGQAGQVRTAQIGRDLHQSRPVCTKSVSRPAITSRNGRSESDADTNGLKEGRENSSEKIAWQTNSETGTVECRVGADGGTPNAKTLSRQLIAALLFVPVVCIGMDLV